MRHLRRCGWVALALCGVLANLTACDTSKTSLPPAAYVDAGARFPELHLVKVGGEWTPGQREQIDRLGVARDITHLVGLSRWELAEVYRRATVVLVLNVWATWCAPCRKELPSLQRLSEQLDPQRFAVLGLSVDADDHVVREFLIERKLTFTNWQDPDMRVARSVLGVRAYPSTYLITADGSVRRVVGGAQPWDSPEWLTLIRSMAD